VCKGRIDQSPYVGIDHGLCLPSIPTPKYGVTSEFASR
jgi:hypothetical protein